MPRKTGSATVTATRAPRARDKAWQSMRILRRFSLPELVATADIGLSNADKYVNGLTGSGFLRVVQPKASGHKGGHAVYQLVRNTGPIAPRLRSDGWVYDVNTGEIHQGGIKQ